MSGDTVGKWVPGTAYGPVLSVTDLFLLQASEGLKILDLNPILENNFKKFHLVLNLSNGVAGGFDEADQDKDLPFTQGDEPATFPRVQELYIISRLTPWVTIVKAGSDKRGVTLGDVVRETWKTYGEHNITDVEWASLPPREQERARRVSLSHQAERQQAQGQQWNPYSPSPQVLPGNKMRRFDWLRDKYFFDGLERDDNYSLKRLGFKAPNVFIMGFAG